MVLPVCFYGNIQLVHVILGTLLYHLFGVLVFVRIRLHVSRI